MDNDPRGRVYDIEAQVSREPRIGRRMRYYQSAMDVSEPRPFASREDLAPLFFCKLRPRCGFGGVFLVVCDAGAAGAGNGTGLSRVISAVVLWQNAVIDRIETGGSPWESGSLSSKTAGCSIECYARRASAARCCAPCSG